jgi:hypothetical protein
MTIKFECKWCHCLFLDRKECLEHEPCCYKNPASRSCETCDNHDTVVADTGKEWNTCSAGLLSSLRWDENYATNCPRWEGKYIPIKPNNESEGE